MPKQPSPASKKGRASPKHSPRNRTHSKTQPMNTNMQSKPWPCGECEKRFARSGDLRRHEKIHWSEEKKEALGAWQYCSYYPECKRRFLQCSNRRTHERTHNPEGDSISCPSCVYTTTDPSLLFRHRVRLHSYRPRPRNNRTQTTHIADTSQAQSQPESSSSANTPASSQRSTPLESPASTVDTSLPESYTSFFSDSSSSSYSPINSSSMHLLQSYSPYHSSQSSFSPSDSPNSHNFLTPFNTTGPSSDSFVPRSLASAAPGYDQCHNRDYSLVDERLPAYYHSHSTSSSESSFDARSTASAFSGASSSSQDLETRSRTRNYSPYPGRMSPIEPVEGSSGLRNFASHAAPPIAEIPYPIHCRPNSDANTHASSSYGMRRTEGYHGYPSTRNAEPERIQLPPISTFFDMSERGMRDFAAGPSRPRHSYHRDGPSGAGCGSSSSCCGGPRCL
ncbi:hypothetical protein D9758_008091 [Tetrapyrgos nigripes]|uniref:C2H2-type domain-containing protein n=1 Tax=Tetrapyrgos nigripes TaxID=182062 RepID=A0A8H5GHD8_9AGAR|nr:hypothetical protein D9758_008091 [Tetrapyrgos nigripes]